MKQYKYKELTLSRSLASKTLNSSSLNLLNSYGAEGWKVIDINNNIFLLCREEIVSESIFEK